MDGKVKSGAEDRGPRSLARLFSILEIVARSPDGLTLTEIAVAVGVPKSSLLGLLRPLVGMGYLYHASSRYRLGPAVFRFASDILAARDLPRLIRPFLVDLVERTGETAILGTIDRTARTVIYSDVVDSPQMVRYTAPMGATRPLYSSAAGRLLLAFQTTAWRDRYLAETELRPVTSTTVTDPEALRAKLAAIRTSGVSATFGETVSEAAGIAAPLVSPGGVVDACILLAGPLERFRRRAAEFQVLVRGVAAEASGLVVSPVGPAPSAAAETAP
jgi:IclR family acetate operon transcriptional repressor